MKSTPESLRKEVKEKPMFRKWDIVLLLVILVVATLAIVFAFTPSGSYAEVYVNGEFIKRLELSQDTEFAVDGHLTIVVDGGGIYIKDADCPDKLCEYASKIYRDGMSITCLPNRIVVVIRGDDDIDGVT